MPFSGLLLLEKPADFTSTYVTTYVKKSLRALCQKKIKIGHIGTLDPFATGLLPLAIGEGTRLIPWIEKRQKSYIFTLRWGAETTTGDYTGDVLEISAFRPSTQEIKAILSQFRGEIIQIPPRFSALKVGGKRAYELARAGIEFTLEPRPQYITQLELLEAYLDEATFGVSCNTGSYVRTLGQVGKWILSQAISLDSLKKIAHDKDKLRAFLIRPRAKLDDIPAIEVEEEEALLGFIAILNLTEPAHAEEPDSLSCPPSSALSKTSRPLLLNPYCRVFKGCRNGAVYMTIHLLSPDVLKKASVDPEIADHVELHTHQEKNGVMQMTPLPEITLPTGILELKPGRDHIMLIGLLKELEPGKKLLLSLEFEKSGSLDVEALVEGPQWKKKASRRKICHCEEL